MLIQQDFSCPKCLITSTEANQRKAHYPFLFLQRHRCSGGKQVTLKPNSIQRKLAWLNSTQLQRRLGTVSCGCLVFATLLTHTSSANPVQMTASLQAHPHTPRLSLSMGSKGQPFFTPTDVHKAF